MRKKDLKAGCIGKGGMFGDQNLFENRDYCFNAKRMLRKPLPAFLTLLKIKEIFSTDAYLSKLNTLNSSLCTFCKNFTETFEHLCMVLCMQKSFG